MNAASRMVAAGLALLVTAVPLTAGAADLYSPGSWSSLSSDPRAQTVGDSLTILVFENNTASNSAQNGTKKTNRIGGDISAGQSFSESAQLNVNSAFDGAGQTTRSGRMVAQISVIVEQVLPNGDLLVAGEQTLNLNGDKTHIKVRGQVRRVDISGANTVLSSRLAGAVIDYDGTGFVARGAKPGIVARVFSWLGLP